MQESRKEYWALRVHIVHMRKGILGRRDKIIGVTTRVGDKGEIKEIHDQIVKIFSRNGVTFREK